MQQDTIVIVSALRRFGRLYSAPRFFGLVCLLALLPLLSLSPAVCSWAQTQQQTAAPTPAAANPDNADAAASAIPSKADSPRDATAILTDTAEAEVSPAEPAAAAVPDSTVPAASEAAPTPQAAPSPASTPQASPTTQAAPAPQVAPNTAPEAPPLPQPLGFVATCFDGDTLKLTDRRVVRLAGIDAPELARGDRRGQLFAREARVQLAALAQGQQVKLLQAGVKHRDLYGRILAEVMLPDGRSLNEIMVRNGAAYFYPHRDLSPQLQERLRTLQHEAIAERRGMWGFLLSQPVAKNTYLGNKESLRFFPSDCAEAQSIRPRNRVYFGNLMDAFMAGYAPARVCPFWPVTP
ncbi:MAG: hypothetical protein BCS36_10870 [Desulfovibrio sp. MES5]|uniref:thermonuclease family protein n=1 Tax=Desulfovibrio sp. MES5 TaxID=1899016 RepID=UPI000B9CED95|nr:thermonuclease family protein [Desulfovibrio sp. MES5]OXS27831.1 MAG: hypothetical protein BCS36_10870 [Desulfovibrio sp. MES5]